MDISYKKGGLRAISIFKLEITVVFLNPSVFQENINIFLLIIITYVTVTPTTQKYKKIRGKFIMFTGKCLFQKK